MIILVAYGTIEIPGAYLTILHVLFDKLLSLLFLETSNHKFDVVCL